MKNLKKLEMLDMGVDFANQEFHDIGNITDIPEFIAMINRRPLEEKLNHQDKRGFYFQGSEKGILHHFFAYQLNPNDIPQAVFIRGHEEMHALHGSGNLHLMQPKLSEYGNSFDLDKIPIFLNCSYDEREIVADIGGIYALLTRGMHYKFLKNYGDVHPKAVSVFEANQIRTKIIEFEDILALINAKA